MRELPIIARLLPYTLHSPCQQQKCCVPVVAHPSHRTTPSEATNVGAVQTLYTPTENPSQYSCLRAITRHTAVTTEDHQQKTKGPFPITETAANAIFNNNR